MRFLKLTGHFGQKSADIVMNYTDVKFLSSNGKMCPFGHGVLYTVPRIFCSIYSDLLMRLWYMFVKQEFKKLNLLLEWGSE